MGLLANGSSGQWDVAVDETTVGADRWFLQIDGPAVSFYFEIPAVDVVGRMSRFLDPGGRHGSLVLGKGKDLPVTLVKDDEYRDRFFLAVGPPARPAMRFTIAGADAAMLAEALRQAEQDLVDGD